MKKLFLATLLTLSCFAQAQADIRLEIGARLPKRYVSSEANMTMTAAGQMRPFVDVKVKNVKCLIAYDEKTRRIKYISIMDMNFRTVNGLKIGDEITFTIDDLDIHSYFEIRGPAGSDGWFPIIAHDDPTSGGDFIDKLKRGEKATMSIIGFSKGGN
jgi:hypothetical protein